MSYFFMLGHEGRNADWLVMHGYLFQTASMEYDQLKKPYSFFQRGLNLFWLLDDTKRTPR